MVLGRIAGVSTQAIARGAAPRGEPLSILSENIRAGWISTGGGPRSRTPAKLSHDREAGYHRERRRNGFDRNQTFEASLHDDRRFDRSSGGLLFAEGSKSSQGAGVSGGDVATSRVFQRGAFGRHSRAGHHPKGTGQDCCLRCNPELADTVILPFNRGAAARVFGSDRKIRARPVACI